MGHVKPDTSNQGGL